MKLTGNK